MKKKNCLVTGSLGYIGSKFVLALEEKGNKVKGFDRPLDIRNERQVEAAVKGMDEVYHLAALAQIKYTDEHPDETFETNVVGANVMAKMCAKHGVKLHFVSTCCIYGEPLEKPSVEDGLINPTDLYAMSKAAGEYVVKMWGLKGLDASKVTSKPFPGVAHTMTILNEKSCGYILQNTLSYLLKILPTGWEAAVMQKAGNKIMKQAAMKIERQWRSELARPRRAGMAVARGLASYFTRAA